MTCLRLIRRKKQHQLAPAAREIDEGTDILSPLNTKLFSYYELKVATGSFHQSNKIGEGGFGVVYKGTLEDGTVAAIKVLSANSKQGLREFLTEIKMIAPIEHENLVKLLGCCAEGDHRILVYGYLENNSLAQTLIGGRRSSIQFSWRTRTEICMGVAKGLAYLHEEVQPYIVHRDIKASNILLDKDLKAKISDFGLAKFFPNNATHVSTRVAGTIGYLAPEYAVRGQLTRKADIYSFGILLLEIVSGRSNTNKRLPATQQYILEWAWELHERGELLELVDFMLNADFNADEALRYLKIGLICTQENAKLRPCMSAVLKMLSGETDVSEVSISRPGMLAVLRSLKMNKDLTNTSLSDSAGTRKQENNSSSSSSENVMTSHATMTFNSIYNRST